MAIRLRRSGRDDFLILEQAHDVGGTWRENTYPGCACDIPSHMYSFSYAPNPDWTRRYSCQPEIWNYLRQVTDDFDVRTRIRFGAQVTSARWDDEEQLWRVDTADGTAYAARILVAGVGGLHIPHVPRLPGRERFTGVTFHSARWRHDVDLTGKRVAVVGTGASAIQFVPQIARTRQAPQRLPAHGSPGCCRGLTDRLPPAPAPAFRRVPGLQRLHRYGIYWLLEARALGFNGHPALLHAAERDRRLTARAQGRRPAAAPTAVAGLPPGLQAGAVRERLLPHLQPRQRDLVPGAVERITATGVVGSDGVERAADVIISPPASRCGLVRVREPARSPGQHAVGAVQRDGAETYLGINVGELPQPVPAARAQHRARSPLGRVHDRAAGRVRDPAA
jgi:cation diffusion facilitator CzcD-associated flavoprotein CzcO